MKKETKIETEAFVEPEKPRLFKKYNRFLPILAAVLIVLTAVLLYLYSLTLPAKTEQAAAKTQECGVITAENGAVEGTVPFAPKLTAKISGNYDSRKASCHWKVNGAVSHDTYPVNDTCVFALRNIATPGEHTISYEVDGLNDGCPQSIKIKVNKQ